MVTTVSVPPVEDKSNESELPVIVNEGLCLVLRPLRSWSLSAASNSEIVEWLAYDRLRLRLRIPSSVLISEVRVLDHFDGLVL